MANHYDVPSFNKNYASFENNFDDLHRNFWIGLKELHILTSNGSMGLSIIFAVSFLIYIYIVFLINKKLIKLER